MLSNFPSDFLTKGALPHLLTCPQISSCCCHFIRDAEEKYLGLVTLLEDIASQERRHRVLSEADAKVMREKDIALWGCGLRRMQVD